MHQIIKIGTVSTANMQQLGCSLFCTRLARFDNHKKIIQSFQSETALQLTRERPLSRKQIHTYHSIKQL